MDVPSRRRKKTSATTGRPMDKGPSVCGGGVADPTYLLLGLLAL
jgi:hypothetical protein